MTSNTDRASFNLDDTDSLAGFVFNLTILGLIFLSCIIFVAETYTISPAIAQTLHWLDLFILIVFTVEYILRFLTAPSKLKFVFSFFGLIDLVAILPLLLGFIDLRFLRVFRWFRILRIIRFSSLEISIFRIQTEDGIILARIILTLFSLIFVYSGIIYQIERSVQGHTIKNFFDALYFCVVTMTTVGYGDVTPLSQGGKIMTLIIILTGVLLIPWQLSELLQRIIKTANGLKRKVCSGCGLTVHDNDALFCKRCGTEL